MAATDYLMFISTRPHAKAFRTWTACERVILLAALLFTRRLSVTIQEAGNEQCSQSRCTWFAGATRLAKKRERAGCRFGDRFARGNSCGAGCEQNYHGRCR